MITLGQAFELAADSLRKGDYRQAEQLFRLVLNSDPRHVGALHGLGLVAFSAGNHDLAVTCLHQAVSLKPDHADALYHLGNVLWVQGKLNQAADSFRQALTFNPNLTNALNNLGGVLLQQGRPAEALTCLENALRLQPDDAEAHHNRGTVLVELGRLEEAAAAYRQAVRIQPGYAEAHNNLANVLRQLGRLDEATANVREALRLQPNYADAFNNLGNFLADQRKMAEAEAAYREAVRCDPSHAWIHQNLGTHLLLVGKFEEGWQEYEWRLKTREFAVYPLPQPRWDGSRLDGKTVLFHAEQGLGDTVHFIRYAPLVQERGGRVVVVCPGLLIPLLARSPGVDQLVTAGALLPSFDVQAPLASLPGIFGTNAATIPADVPYIFADPSLVQRWRQEVSTAIGFNVGIAWRGSSRHKKDRERSVNLETLAPLAAVPGVRLFSLQVGPGREELAAPGNRFDVTDLGGRFDPESFADVAAVMQSLALVITVDSALAHVAGALGTPVWVALPFSPDWRWLLEREDNPWYPTMRLFRQSQAGRWPEVFERMAEELRKRVR